MYKGLIDTKRPRLGMTVFEQILCITFSIFFFISVNARAQCNTTLNKLLPDASVNNADRFGSAIAANEQYMVVAAENSDTTGIFYGGAAFVYEKTVAGWAYRAMLTPSDPDEYDFFGNSVAIDASGNTIVIINRNYTKGAAYVFEKPASGWETMKETANIKFPEYLEFNSALDISDDGFTIVVSNPMSPNGLLYLLRKPVGGWTSAVMPETLATRAEKSNIHLGNDVLIKEDYIYASAGNEGSPAIYVYKRTGFDYLLLAKLASSLSPGVVGHFGHDLTAYGDMIVATGLAYESNTITQRFFLFRKTGEWINMYETAQFHLTADLASYRFPYSVEFTSATQIAAAVLTKEGEYYAGKVIEMTTTDGTWNDLSFATLFEDPEMSRLSEFSNGLVWNGFDLLMAAAPKQIDHSYRNSVVSLSRSGGIWGSLQQVTLPRKSSSNVFFGTSIVKTRDAMFAGAPYDGSVGRGAGAVYIYNRAGDDFVRVHTIYPSPRKIRPSGGSDAAFGYSVSVYGDDMAVGAPSFLYGSNVYGKIFMYRRTADDWTSAILYDSLVVPEDLELNHVGAAIAMNDQVLFASAYNNYADAHTNAVVVFEKINEKWTYRQLITMGKPIDKSWPSVKFSLNGNQLAVGQYFTVNGGISIINKNPVTGIWQVTASIPASIYSGLGSAVKLMDNHLIAGAPGLSYNNVYRSGAVLVFTKLPGESWSSDIQASALIGAKDPVEGAFFGSSLDVVGNTLAVGAPGMFLTFDGKVRTIPGNTYIIQSQDYYWTNTTEYLNLQGDRYASGERDHFGSCVALDEEYFYVGARSENTATGKFSGAVYYIPTPPVIFLEPPACADAEPLVLKGYPYNGTWSGPGVDATHGTFDPSLVGSGIFTLTYSTPNCHYDGTVQIEVKKPLTVEQLSMADVLICSEKNTTLMLESIPGAAYNWYYRQEGGDAFSWLGKGNASFVATNPGDYKASVSSGCSAESPVFRVRIENFSVSVGPQDVVCSAEESVSLLASNNSGAWEGTGVSGNRFSAAGLSNGIYSLIYRIKTPTGCDIALRDSIKVNRVAPVTIIQTANNFCETGSVNLQARPGDNTLAYTWYYKESLTGSMLPIDQDLLNEEATVYKQGYYQASATNGECSNTSNVLEIGFNNELSYKLVPEENEEVKLCNADEFIIAVTTKEGTRYTWQFKPADSDAYDILQEETASVIVTESGYYRVIGEYGFCSFESSPVFVEFFRDEIFVPNFFTPNGDDRNPRMKVQTNSTIYQFSVFNRFGDQMYSDASGEWDGGEAPAGVYFWYLKYRGCEQDAELKGWVNLQR